MSTPYPLAPPTHGGRVRVQGLAAGLADAGAQVSVLAPWHPARGAADAPRGVRVERHVLPRNLLPAVAPASLVSPQALLSLGPGRPEAVRRPGRYDVYQFEFCAQAAWAERLPPEAKVVYSAHNVEAEFARGLGRGRVASLERRMARRADLILACSEQDAQRLEQLYGVRRPVVIPHGRGPEAGRAGREERERARAGLGIDPRERVVLFLGGNASHNREAARFLAEQVAPALGPGRRLLLAGRCASPRRFGPQALGWVDDLGALFAAADVAVNPVVKASGSSVKVTDFLAAGLPVLATPEGSRGHEGATGLRVVAREGFAAELDRAAEWDGGPVAPPPTWAELGARVLAELDAPS